MQWKDEVFENMNLRNIAEGLNVVAPFLIPGVVLLLHNLREITRGISVFTLKF